MHELAAGPAGLQLVPDLALAVPTPSHNKSAAQTRTRLPAHNVATTGRDRYVTDYELAQGRPVVEDNRNGSRITRTETQASGGSKEGVVRYVLIVSLVLVVIAFVIAYLLTSLSER